LSYDWFDCFRVCRCADTRSSEMRWRSKESLDSQ
jgi:hypothetical protein